MYKGDGGMNLNSNLYMHELDRTALQALKAIPGFTQLLKAFMKVWNEKQFHIQNMSTNLRLSEKQMAKYYNMLPPICEKLGIEVPELYLELDVVPNAYTYGDTKPFIVITSGLLETMPEHLIPTVLVHECGHIACHHTLYTTMGQLILNGAISLLGLSELATLPIQVAFYYWMRCSEYSADRTAIICDGNADNIIEMCMRFAGYDKDINAEANIEAFMEQAIDYKEMVNDSKWNKTLEFLMLSHVDHPFNAVRAYEAKEWVESENFAKLVTYIERINEDFEAERNIPFCEASNYYVGKNYLEVQLDLHGQGFSNIELVRQTEKNLLLKEGQVTKITTDNYEEFKIGDWYTSERKIILTYYQTLSDDEIIAMHPNELRVPEASKKYIGRNYKQVVDELKTIGFHSFVFEGQPILKKGWGIVENNVSRISIDGVTQFEKGMWFKEDAIIIITYYIFCKD